MLNRSRGALVALAVAGAAVTAGISAGPAQAAAGHPIRNYGNRKCMDVATQNDYLVQLWSCNGKAQQEWTETWAGANLSMTNQRTGECLGVDENVRRPGARVVVLPCGEPSTSWSITYANNTGSGWHQQLLNTNSGQCLDLLDNNSANGTRIQLWDCWPNNPPGNAENNPAQLWML